jgi:hypothetical protein
VPAAGQASNCATCNGGIGGSSECDDSGECGTTSRCDYNVLLPQERLWVRGEYLLGWSKSASLPALATTSVAGTPENQAGVQGLSSTSLLFGGAVDPGARSGMRLTLGYWFCPCHDAGLEAVYTNFSSAGASFYEESNATGSPILARPFRNAQTGAEDSLVIAYPGSASGSIDIRSVNDFSSIEVLLREAVLGQCDRRLDFLVGYRYSRFNEALSVYSPTTNLSRTGQFPVDTLVEFTDEFNTTNHFHGVELGFSGKDQFRRLSLEVLGKLALGRTQSRVMINGSSTVTQPGQSPVTYNGGLLAAPSNINSEGFEYSALSLMPEFGVMLGYDITCRLKATAGYSVVYWSNLMRPGDQISTDVNTSQLLGRTGSGLGVPTYKAVPGDFWVQSFTVGLDYRF